MAGGGGTTDGSKVATLMSGYANADALFQLTDIFTGITKVLDLYFWGKKPKIYCTHHPLALKGEG